MVTYQIVPFDKKTGNQLGETERFTSLKVVRIFLSETQSRWRKWDYVQVVNASNGKVVEVWQEIR